MVALKVSGLCATDLLYFSPNINPLGPPEWLRSAISAAVAQLDHYPDPEATELRAVAAQV